jgi:peptide/nickel transport system substrate-binding protein
LIADYLSSAGIGSSVRSLELNSWAAEKDKYHYDLIISRTTPWGMLMHAGWGSGYFDSRRSGRGVLHTVDDPAFLDLCDSVLKSTDPKERRNLGKKIQDYYAEQLPAAALYWNLIITPANDRFSGWKPDPLYGIYNTDTFLSLERRNGG